MYITLEDYKAIYDSIDERLFNNLAFEACRVMDIHTTGIDNIKKLKVAFPTDPDYAETVKRCASKLVNIMYQIQQAEIAAVENRGYDMTEQGLRGKVISSVSQKRILQDFNVYPDTLNLIIILFYRLIIVAG